MPIKIVSHILKKHSGEWNVIPNEIIDFTPFAHLKYLVIIGESPSADDTNSTDTITVFNLRIWKHTLPYDNDRICMATDFIRKRNTCVLNLAKWFPKLESVQIHYLHISQLTLPSTVTSLTLVWCKLLNTIDTPNNLRCLVLNGCYNALSKIPLPPSIRSMQIYGEHIPLISVCPDLHHLYLDTCKVDKIVNASHLFYMPVNGFNLHNCISPYNPYLVNTQSSVTDPWHQEKDKHRMAMYVHAVNTRMDNEVHTEILVRLRNQAFNISNIPTVSNELPEISVIRQTMILSSNYMRRATEFISKVP